MIRVPYYKREFLAEKLVQNNKACISQSLRSEILEITKKYTTKEIEMKMRLDL